MNRRMSAIHRHQKQLRHLDPKGSARLSGKIAGVWDVRVSPLVPPAMRELMLLLDSANDLQSLVKALACWQFDPRRPRLFWFCLARLVDRCWLLVHLPSQRKDLV